MARYRTYFRNIVPNAPIYVNRLVQALIPVPHCQLRVTGTKQDGRTPRSRPLGPEVAVEMWAALCRFVLVQPTRSSRVNSQAQMAADNRQTPPQRWPRCTTRSGWHQAPLDLLAQDALWLRHTVMAYAEQSKAHHTITSESTLVSRLQTPPQITPCTTHARSPWPTRCHVVHVDRVLRWPILVTWPARTSASGLPVVNST